MPKVFTPTEEDLTAVFANSMWYEIVYTFGVPKHDPWDYCQWEMINLSRMAHARVLYGFLETKKEDRRFNDDVLAEDFGYPAQPVLLPKEDRERLNKDLFHLSYRRLRHTKESKRWPDSIIANLLEPTLGFMRYIRDSRANLFSSSTESESWRDTITLLESGRELQIASFEDQEGMMIYQVISGPPLPGGKPALTKLLSRN
jgi:hypothetical protein